MSDQTVAITTPSAPPVAPPVQPVSLAPAVAPVAPTAPVATLVGEEPTKVVPELQLVVFRLDEEEYALDIADVLKVIAIPEITPIPNAPVYLTGFINLAGKVIPVIDLESKFNLKRGQEKKQLEHIVVVEGEGSAFGMMVDKVLEVMRVPQSTIQQAPELIKQKIGSQYIKGVIVIGKDEESDELSADRPDVENKDQAKASSESQRILLQIDVKKLLGSNEQQVVQAVYAQASEAAPVPPLAN